MFCKINNFSKKHTSLIVLGVFFLLFVGCAAGVNSAEDTPNEDGNVAGFWRGFWQGMIAPITWFISLFADSVNVYEVHNNGGWYDFGFVLGAGIILGGSGRASS